MTQIAMLGGGNGGLALAGDLASRGLSVSLYEHPAFAESLAPIARTRRLTVEDARSRQRTEVELTCATTDLREAIREADLVSVIVPVSAQESIFAELLPRIAEKPLTVVLWAGRFGSYRYRKLARDAGIPLDLAPIVEVNTLPYGCRRIEEAAVRITARATVLYAAGLPEAACRPALDILAGLFPILRRAASPFEAAMRNSGTPVLGVGALLNVGGIEASEGRFALFREGMTPGVRRAIRALHLEMIAVAAAWGVTVPPYDEAVYAHPMSIESANFRDSEGGFEGFKQLTGPDRIDHRYTVENVRYGFALIAQMGRARGVPTPVLEGFTAVADAICGADFARLGWTLEDLDDLRN